MTTTKNIHPDFLRTLSAEQRAWCAANGIEIAKGDRGFGFFFSKGEMWIEPIPANAHKIWLMEVDGSEDGDGAANVDTFDSLRDALRRLAA